MTTTKRIVLDGVTYRRDAGHGGWVMVGPAGEWFPSSLLIAALDRIETLEQQLEKEWERGYDDAIDTYLRNVR